MKPVSRGPAQRRQALLLIALAALCCLLPMRPARAAPRAEWNPFPLPQLQQTALRSAAGARYRVVVATPAGPAPANGYPVIYVVDGDAWTGLVSEIIRANIGAGVQSRVEPAVVVGIG